jgi:hypothetical protein
MKNRRPHIIVPSRSERIKFSLKNLGGNKSHPSAVSQRTINSQRILGEIEEVISAAISLPNVEATRIPMSVRAGTEWGVTASMPGSRNDVLSSIGFKKNARLNISFSAATLESIEKAAKKYSAYEEGRKPQYFDFFESMPLIALTELEDLWASNLEVPDYGEQLLWEVWMPRASEPRFREALEELHLSARRAIPFNHLRVIAVEATREIFEELVMSGAIAQLRPASALTSEVVSLPAGIQEATVAAARRRITPAPKTAPAVCLLDTGILQNHPLLVDSIDLAADLSGASPSDWGGHGTKMAGLALYDDLPGLISGGATAEPPIRLESVVIEPPPGINDHRLPAERLGVAVDLVERNSRRSRTYCFAMSAVHEGDDGGVSSLSSEIDRLAAELGAERLICVPAGNLQDPVVYGDYQALNETAGLATPAQSWNALTVAACTDLGQVPSTHSTLAPPGDLSPYSRTACAWDRNHKPPMKPDVVFEGGNRMFDIVSQDLSNHPDLCLLTTGAFPGELLALTGMTSAATAAVSGMCARLQAAYPMLWPETIRGLIAHSSEYTPAMEARAQVAANTRGSAQAALLERYGYGRPNLARAIDNAEDTLTFITQGALLPLRANPKEDAAILGYMRHHQLPWPSEILKDLEQTPAELRVTLSYFVEPNPGAVLSGKYDLYASHGFDFDVKRPDESDEQAIARINGEARAGIKSSAPPMQWVFGSKERGGPLWKGGRRGGLKHDRVTMPAEDLARCGSIMVFPRKGWWGGEYDRIEQQARYSLIVTIRTPEEEIYTKIATEIEAS